MGGSVSHLTRFVGLLYGCVFIACGGGTPTQSLRNNAGGSSFELSEGKLPRTIETEKGRLSIEEEYIPGVVACEIGRRLWGGAAMEAQAIAARTYLARYLERTKGSKVIPIGPRFQCWKPTDDYRVRQAALSTASQVLRYEGALITGNYVAGTPHLTAGCDPLPPTNAGYTGSTWGEMLATYRDDRKQHGRTLFKGTAWTEIFVTRNEGKSGEDVSASAIARPVNYNRGALGQNAAVCLTNNLGYETLDILRYFYGEDIELVIY